MPQVMEIPYRLGCPPLRLNVSRQKKLARINKALKRIGAPVITPETISGLLLDRTLLPQEFTHHLDSGKMRKYMLDYYNRKHRRERAVSKGQTTDETSLTSQVVESQELPDSSPPVLLTAEETARMLSISKSTLSRRVREGVMPGIVRTGTGKRSGVRFRASAVVELIEGGGFTPECAS